MEQDDVDVGRASYSAVTGRRMKKATDFLTDEVALVDSITIALVTQPMDQLVLVLLKLDLQGGLLADLTSKRASPTRDAQRKFVEMLRDGVVTRLVGDYFRMNSEQRREHMSNMCNMIVELAAGIYFRMDLYFGRFPFLLLRLVHPDRPLGERAQAAADFASKPMCCLDPFSLVVCVLCTLLQTSYWLRGHCSAL